MFAQTKRTILSERDLEAHEIEQGIGENFYSEVCVLFFHVHSDIKPDLRENTDESLWKNIRKFPNPRKRSLRSLLSM